MDFQAGNPPTVKQCAKVPSASLAHAHSGHQCGSLNTRWYAAPGTGPPPNSGIKPIRGVAELGRNCVENCRRHLLAKSRGGVRQGDPGPLFDHMHRNETVEVEPTGPDIDAAPPSAYFHGLSLIHI